MIENNASRRWRARLPAWDWRARLQWFLAEFLVVVSGVLVALALNAWYQNQKDAESEASYLTLLDRDLQHTLDNLEEFKAFEELQVRDGLMVYRALSRRDTDLDVAAVALAMSRLGTRRTLRLNDATYEDLLHTGNLQIIRNPELRSRLVEFYEDAERQIEIVDRNNAFFVDEMYNAQIMGRGLITPRPTTNLQSTAAIDSVLTRQLDAGYIDEQDALWSLPDGAPEWAVVKSLLLWRIRISAYAQTRADGLMDSVRGLQSAVAAERRRR